MYEQYREEDEHFYETNGRLIFLAYLKPILNGKGFSFVEPQTRKNKRMDVVITYGTKKYIVELKIWNGEAYREKGIHQLVEYMVEQGVKESPSELRSCFNKTLCLRRGETMTKDMKQKNTYDYIAIDGIAAKEIEGSNCVLQVTLIICCLSLKNLLKKLQALI